jgi:phenylacetate-CoA ligase
MRVPASKERQARLPTYEIGDASRMPRPELRRLQGERLATMLAYVYRRSDFWLQRLDAYGVAPADVKEAADIRKLPTCTKAELLADQRAHPPFGSNTCTPMSEWSRYFSTSGTASTPLRRVLSRRDWHLVLKGIERLPPPCHNDVVVLTAPVDGNMSLSSIAEHYERRGALVVAMGTRPDRQKVEAIAELRPTKVVGIPSYLLHLTELAERLGIDLSTRGVRMILSGLGEAGVAVESTNRLLRDRFGAPAVVDGYGLTELFPLGSNCSYSNDLHLYEDMTLVETLRPDVDEPVAPGEVGELTYTNLVGDTQPVLRYRSGDLGALSDGRPCACGSRQVRIVGSTRGRVDDPGNRQRAAGARTLFARSG